MHMRWFAKPVAKPLEQKLTQAATAAYKNIMKDVPNPPPFISGEIKLDNDIIRRNVQSHFRPATKEEMTANYEQLEASRRNGPSW